MSNAISFLQDLIRIPSLPDTDAQRACGQRVVQEMRAVGFDEAWIDDGGNAIGLFRGQQRGPAWLLLTHLDVVDKGDESLWQFPPFEGVWDGDAVHGRGAVDIKGPLAAHVYTIQRMCERGERPVRDVVVLAAWNEETVGDGARYFVRHLPMKTPSGETFAFGACVVSEPSSNRVMLGHRGVMRTIVRFHGRAHHASLAINADNPHFALARFLARLEQAQLAQHPILGKTTIAPTVILTDTRSQNLSPNVIELVLDIRFGTETRDDLQQLFDGLTNDLNATFTILPMESNGPLAPRYFGPDGLSAQGFVIEPSNPLVSALMEAARTVKADAPVPGVWNFATDGRYTHFAAIPTVGFGPGDPALAHTTREHIRTAEIDEAIAVFVALLNRDLPPTL